MADHGPGAAGGADERRGMRSTDADRPIHQVRSDGRIIGEIRFDTPVFVISVAAELAGMHAQTLRSYDREGLVSPRRTSGGGRRYSQRDIELLQQVQQLSQDEGVNRAGIRRIMELENYVDTLRDQIDGLAADLAEARAALAAELRHTKDDGAYPRGETPGNRPAARRDIVPWRSPTTTIVTWRSVG